MYFSIEGLENEKKKKKLMDIFRDFQLFQKFSF